ncbi:hypothetical protein RJT34_02985 [Clitoria ternatea]|uniref:Uncharacterized protein n=1 Tax=Clitoria ternatea TaxID=43366 RepID=A0AAN9KJZ1_CLITE
MHLLSFGHKLRCSPIPQVERGIRCHVVEWERSAGVHGDHGLRLHRGYPLTIQRSEAENVGKPVRCCVNDGVCHYGMCRRLGVRVCDQRLRLAQREREVSDGARNYGMCRTDEFSFYSLEISESINKFLSSTRLNGLFLLSVGWSGS